MATTRSSLRLRNSHNFVLLPIGGKYLSTALLYGFAKYKKGGALATTDHFSTQNFTLFFCP